MTEKTGQNRKVLKKKPNSVIKTTAEDLICIPRPLYEQMISALKGQATNGGRAQNLLSELPEIIK